jgi:hypothetical protein
MGVIAGGESRWGEGSIGSLRSVISNYGIERRAGWFSDPMSMRRPACRYRTGAKARVFIPARCSIRNMAGQNAEMTAKSRHYPLVLMARLF